MTVAPSASRLARCGPTNVGRSACIVLVVLALMGFGTGAVQAQPTPSYGLAVAVDATDGITTPITGTAQATATVEITCPTGMVPDTEDRTVRYEITTNHPEWTTVSVSPSSHTFSFSPQQCVEETPIEKTVDITLSFNKDAPAYATTKLIFAAQIEGEDVVASDEWTEQAGFYEHHQARFAQAIHKAEPNSIVLLALEIENLANGPIEVRFAASDDLTSHALQFIVPNPIMVGSAVQGDEHTATASIEVRTPFKDGYMNRQDAMAIDMAIYDATGQERLEPLQATAVIQTQGWGDGSGDATGELPTTGLAPAGLALFGILAVARRRQP